MIKKNNLPNVWNKAKTWPTKGTLYFNETEEKTYIFEAKKGCYPAWHEVDPFEDLEERKVKK